MIGISAQWAARGAQRILMSAQWAGHSALRPRRSPAPSALRPAPFLSIVALLLAFSASAASDPWSAVPEILARIQPPHFPARDFVITKYGAKSGSDAGAAIEKAIKACSLAGGGRVVIPPGDWPTGPIRLASHIDLHVEAGATLRFTTDPAKYPLVLTRFEGVEVMNYSPLIYATDCEDVAITGEGTLDGQADEQHWWNWKPSVKPQPQNDDRNALFKQNEDQVPVAQRAFGAGHFLRPSFVEPLRCKNVLIEGVTFRNAPMWVLHPTLSTNVTIRRVTIIGNGPNTDGADPESCHDVLIEDCVFETGDDCIALKSGRNQDGRRINVPIENVIIRGCRMKAGHGGITVGSEVSGGARNIFAEKNQLDSPILERGLRLKTNSARGGFIENVCVRDIEIGNVLLAPIEIDVRYQDETGTFAPSVRNVLVERMHSAHSRHGLYIRALEQPSLRDIVIRDSAFRGVVAGHVIEGVVDLTLSGVTVEAAPTPKKQEKR
jgi:polygalacturonase